jgi:hypothetical protein
MIKKTLLASTLAAGLIVPVQAKAGLILSPKPAIIKPENIEFSKHMLLGMPLTMGMLAAKKALGSIVFVGGSTASKIGATSGNSTISLNSGLTGGIASSVSNDDLVIAVFVTGSVANRTLAITDGTNPYTLFASELYQDDTFDTNLRVAYKFVNGDTSTTFGPTGSLDDGGAMAVYVFRGVASVVNDVAVVTAQSANSVLADAPSITPVTPGSVVVAVYAGASSTGEAFDTSPFPASLTGWRVAGGNDVNDASLGIGHAFWTSGPFNPEAALIEASDSTNYSWAAMSIALRPA